MSQARTTVLQHPLPALTSGAVTEDHLPVLLWVHSGTASVEAGGATYALSGGEAIWIPPGVEHCTRTGPGGVVLPVFPSTSAPRGALERVRVMRIPTGWEDWLVSQFDFNRHHTRGDDAEAQTLFDLVDSEGSTGPAGSDLPALPTPYSREARAVAVALLRSPGEPAVADQLAARENISVRTLQRQFQTETGLALSEWRTRARVTVAGGLLDTGREVGWVAREVGYATPAGFTRAFRRHVGITPQQYARRRPASAVEAGQAAERRAPYRESPRIRPRQVWNWVYDWHVLWWAYRGEVSIRIGAREVVLRRGQAMWLPAGFSASVDDLADGSILLPLANRLGGANVGPADLHIVALDRFSTTHLLHLVLTEYTLFQPIGDVPSTDGLVDELFQQQFGRDTVDQGGDRLTGAVAVIATSLRRDPADSRSLSAWAAHLGVNAPRVAREFRQQSGRDFPRWRAELRMSLARELLMDGSPPREVSRTLGYASPAAFGHVFSKTHGITPRQYQFKVTRRPVAATVPA